MSHRLNPIAAHARRGVVAPWVAPVKLSRAGANP